MLNRSHNVMHYYIDLMREKTNNECGNALYNVINTMKLSRNANVCNENFSCLDFGNIPLNGIYFSMNGEYASSFRNCKMHEWNFASGHSDDVMAMAWSPNNKYILTGSRDGTAILWCAESGLMLNKLKGHKYAVSSVSFSHDSSLCLTGSSDNEAKIWCVKSGSCKNTLSGHESGILAVSFSDKDEFCFTCSKDHVMKKWEVQSGKCVKTQIFGGLITEYSHNGKYKLSVTENNVVKLYDLETKKYICCFSGHSDAINIVAFSPDDNFCITGSNDNTVKLWDRKTGKCLHILSGHRATIKTVSFTRKGDVVLTGSCDKTIKLWSTETGKCLYTLSGHKASVVFSAFSSKERWFATGSSDGCVKLWDSDKGECIRTLNEEDKTVKSLMFSPDGLYCLVGYDDLTAIKWNIETGLCDPVNVIKSPNDPFSFSKVAISANGQYCLTCSGDKKAGLCLWNINSGECIQTFEGHGNEICSIAFSNDSKYCATGSRDKTAQIWNVESGECMCTFEQNKFWVGAVAFSPDGKNILTGDQEIKLWNLDSGKCLWKTELDHFFDTYLTFSPDGTRFLLTSFSNGSVDICDARNGKIIQRCKNYLSSASTIAYSKDMKKCLIGSYRDNTAKLWDIETEKCICVYRGHKDWIVSSAFSSDALYCITGSNDKTAKLWDLQTHKCLFTFEGHKEEVKTVCFSPDDYFCLTASRDCTKIWRTFSGDCIRTFNGTLDHAVFTADGYHCLIPHNFLNEHKVELWDFILGKGIVFKGRNRVKVVSFSPDNQYCVSCLDNDTMKIWNINTASCVRVINEDTRCIESITFIKNGCYFISGSKTGKWKIWKTENGKLIGSISKDSDERSYVYWAHPYCIVDKNGTVKVKKYKCITNWNKKHFYRKVNDDFKINFEKQMNTVAEFINASALHIENCDFRSVIADIIAHKIIYQFGAITDEN